MFGFLKNLLGGIFSFLGSLLGFKKSEYVLEFESAPADAAAATTQPAKPAATKQSKSAKATAPASAPAKPSKPEVSAPPKSEPAKAPALVGGFATTYLVPTVTFPRRRPGANMNSFLDMARQMNRSR
ncbi:MAG: hypothetical protein N3E45_06310 [Oscillatoriaceae bacterium SKW80]|nr:hypothetical protein [Oscillatoriaceae bacterium SKYG93]MCX8120429.1 hypothetical protein [Oscillatoriaceae bacterium SKW80]MDW8452996.1 hypothetical protein [Oscillatoriaceae cyanobacterium SKYGB_i_bin93]HIK28593.1 hypothetical protein [Oscillatoriaceae cyanobacterium M7585_C2015_266]